MRGDLRRLGGAAQRKLPVSAVHDVEPLGLELVLAVVQPGDVVLVKASRSVGLEIVADALVGVAAR